MPPPRWASVGARGLRWAEVGFGGHEVSRHWAGAGMMWAEMSLTPAHIGPAQAQCGLKSTTLARRRGGTGAVWTFADISLTGPACAKNLCATWVHAVLFA